MTTTRRRSLQLEMVLDATDGLRAAARRIVQALPPRPAARDEAALAEAVALLPELTNRLQRGAARVRRNAPSDEMRELLDIARVTAREVPRVVSALGHVLERRAEPLMPSRGPVTAATRRAEVLSRGFNLLEVAASGDAQAEEMRAHAYPFIPLGAESYVERMQAAWRILAVIGDPACARFLEVGAGAGSKLFLAAQFFPQVDGIELDPNYLARAELIGNTFRPARRVLPGDALAFEGYGEYDVIYSYLPFNDPEMQAALEQRILGQARDGAILILPMLRTDLNTRMPLLPGEIVVKGLGEAALSDLAGEAQFVGTAVPPMLRPEERGGRRNLMLPAIEALARAGFAA